MNVSTKYTEHAKDKPRLALSWQRNQPVDGVTQRRKQQPPRSMEHPTRQIECTIPVLPVRDLQQSIAYYTEKLGFSLDWRGDKVCGVSRDKWGLMLSTDIKPAGTAWVWIGLESDALFEEYRKRGVKVRQEPRNEPWAYEMKFEDPDGNVLWLGTEPRQEK